MKIIEITLRSTGRCQMLNITADVEQVLRDQQLDNGVLTIFTPHTTAAITINENADPDVIRDILHGLDKQVPDDPEFRHAEGNSTAHIKSSLIGASETLLVVQGRLQLGTWQGVFFCEFDGPRQRRVKIALRDA